MMRIAIVGLTIACLWTAATFLARESEERRQVRSQRAAGLGAASLGAGRAAEAVDHFREAVALEPERVDYRLLLARSLLGLRQIDEAEPYLRDVLREDPVHGEANLELARVERRRGNRRAAEQAYYRAIYGRWKAEEQAPRRQARLELVALFVEGADRGRVRTALAELADAFPGDLNLQQNVGRQLLAFGFAHEAARLLRAVVERFARPEEAQTLLAEAEFSRGNYGAALDASTQAIARDPSDVRAIEIRDRADRVLAMDPAQLRLTTGARAERVRVLLAAAVTRLAACEGGRPPAAGPPAAFDVATQWLAQPRRQSANLEIGYGALEDLARLYVRACGPPAAEDAEGLALARIGREAP